MTPLTDLPRHLEPAEGRRRLLELAAVFLRLGTLAFGGPAAHIAMMEDEVVERRRWLDRQTFLDLLGATNLIPGPNSTELAIHIGYLRAGWPGLLVAGTAFILPAMALTWALAATYVRYQTLPQMEGLLYGVKPVVAAVVLQALWNLGRKAVKDLATGLAAGGVAALAWLGVHELALLLLAGLGVMLARRPRGSGAAVAALAWPAAGAAPDPAAIGGPANGAGALATRAAAAGAAIPAAATGTAVSAATGGQVFWVFLKIGSVLYGSGYVLLAFLQKELVERRSWLTAQQVLDAVAVGQVTPGPVFTTATFVGYLLARHAGAVLATVGIFLPAFVLVAAINPWVPRLRQSPWTAGFLDGVNAASLGLMVAVGWQLGTAAVADGVTALLAVLSYAALARFRVNSAWLVVAGGLVGLLVRGMG